MVQMTFSQKLQTIMQVPEAATEIKNLLIRKYWSRRKQLTVNISGISATFSTADYYSNYWFFGPQNLEPVYEPAISRLLIENIGKARAFADIGANLGYFTALAAVAAKTIPIFSFELDQTLMPLIETNVRLNGCTNVVITNAAVGEIDGQTVPYTPHPFSFAAMIASLPTEPFSIQLSATTKSLDGFFATRPMPNFLKMDVDGAEMGVLRGMSNLLDQPDLQMLLEVHPVHLPKFKSSAEEVISFLHARGFAMYLIGDFRVKTSVPIRPLKSSSELTSPSGEMLFVTRQLASSA